MRARTLAIFAGCVILAAICWAQGSATAGTPPRPATAATSPAQLVQTPPGGVGTEDEAAPGKDPGTPWMVTDPDGAPMAWVNLYGLYSGGDGGKMPGGLICVTYATAETVACLTPEGDLTLTPAGPHGATGPAQTLTPHDIWFIHKLERASR